jgi:hypothetical protein
VRYYWYIIIYIYIHILSNIKSIYHIINKYIHISHVNYTAHILVINTPEESSANTFPFPMSSLSVMVCGRHETGAAQAQMPHRQKAAGTARRGNRGPFSDVHFLSFFKDKIGAVEPELSWLFPTGARLAVQWRNLSRILVSGLCWGQLRSHRSRTSLENSAWAHPAKIYHCDAGRHHSPKNAMANQLKPSLVAWAVYSTNAA